jgi:hypothetical protein
VKRREFITLLGGTAAWPLAARAQQPDGMRRIGMLLALAEDDPEIRARLAVFRQGLEKRGWSEGRNVRIDYRFAPPPGTVPRSTQPVRRCTQFSAWGRHTQTAAGVPIDFTIFPVVVARCCDCAPVAGG